MIQPDEKFSDQEVMQELLATWARAEQEGEDEYSRLLNLYMDEVMEKSRSEWENA